MKRQVLETLQPRCRRCGARKNIHRHHVIPRRKGGDDDPDNLMPLCGNCHWEWEHVVEGLEDIDYGPITLDWWLTTPPYRILLIFLLRHECEMVTPEEEMVPYLDSCRNSAHKAGPGFAMEYLKEAWSVWRDDRPFRESRQEEQQRMMDEGRRELEAGL